MGAGETGREEADMPVPWFLDQLLQHWDKCSSGRVTAPNTENHGP